MVEMRMQKKQTEVKKKKSQQKQPMQTQRELTYNIWEFCVIVLFNCTPLHFKKIRYWGSLVLYNEPTSLLC